MKKIILSVVFVLAVAVQMNANLGDDKKFIKHSIFGKTELPSCLTEAYDNTNKLEAASEGGPYSWDIETWSRFYNRLFEMCNNGSDINELTNLMLDN